MEIKTNKLILISKLTRAISKETGVSIKLSDDGLMEQIEEVMQSVNNIETKGLYAKLIGENIATKESAEVMYRGSALTDAPSKATGEVKKKKVMYRGRTL